MSTRPWLGKFGHLLDYCSARDTAGKDFTWRLLINAQRFYFPVDRDILGPGHEYTVELKKLALLPYPCVATLRRQENLWRVSIAASPAYLAQVNLEVAALEGGPDAVLLLGATQHPDGWWHLSRTLSEVNDKPGAVGYLLRRFSLGNTVSTDQLTNESEVAALDWHHVCNLCLMLNMVNVKRERIAPPEKLVRSSARRGRERPLYDYHVLVVDGERWDSEARGGTNDGYRSHLRRGHVRRLSDGARHTWVRAAYVHGRQPGFADKDYEVTT